MADKGESRNDLRRYKSGEALRHQTVNALVDFARASGVPAEKGGYEDQGGIVSRSRKTAVDAGLWFRCESLSDAPAFSILEVYDADLADDGVVLHVRQATGGARLYAGNEQYSLSTGAGGWVKLITSHHPVEVNASNATVFLGNLKPNGNEVEYTTDDTDLIALSGRAEGRVPVLLSSGAVDASDDDEGCSCDRCLPGYTMPASSTVCCDAHPIMEFVDPWLKVTRRLKWTTGNVWLTDEFSDPDCVPANTTPAPTTSGGQYVANTYKYRLTLSGLDPGDALLELVIVDDNGCEVICIQYVNVSEWQCLCDNEMRVSKWENVSRADLNCTTCVKPVTLDYVEMECPSGCETRDPLHVFIPEGTSTDDCVQETMDLIAGFHEAGFELGNWSFDDWTATGGCTSYPCIWEVVPETSLTDASCDAGAKIAVVITSCGGGVDQGLLVQLLYRDDQYAANKWAPVATWEYNDGCLPSGSQAFLANTNPSGGYGSIASVQILGDAIGNVTSDGSCAGCTTPSAPADAEGACCVDGECLDVSSADCTTFGGTWYATDAACEDACGVQGACCAYVDGIGYCYNVTSESHCDDIATAVNATAHTYHPGELCWFSGGSIECDSTTTQAPTSTATTTMPIPTTTPPPTTTPL